MVYKRHTSGIRTGFTVFILHLSFFKLDDPPPPPLCTLVYSYFCSFYDLCLCIVYTYTYVCVCTLSETSVAACTCVDLLSSLQPRKSHIGVKIQFIIEYPFSILRWLTCPPCYHVRANPLVLVCLFCMLRSFIQLQSYKRQKCLL